MTTKNPDPLHTTMHNRGNKILLNTTTLAAQFTANKKKIRQNQNQK